MDIAWWPLSKIAEPIYIYVVPINYESNVFYHDHSMTQINYRLWNTLQIFEEHQIVVASSTKRLNRCLFTWYRSTNWAI